LSSSFNASPYIDLVDKAEIIAMGGYVRRITGLVIEGTGPRVGVGSLCKILPLNNPESCREAEAIGFDERGVLLMPLENYTGIVPGSRIERMHSDPLVQVGNEMLGRIFDGLGRPLDEKHLYALTHKTPLLGRPINPVSRKRITETLDLGIRSINGLLTVGKGQKIGIFSGSGVGKSVLLGMIARYTSADVNVIALIGERGREVREFIEKDLGSEGLTRSVVVVATSDMSPLARIRGALFATAIAEFFRDQGKSVLFMMDSLTRFAIAKREVGLAAGEPPTTKGYTPSVFTLMPSLLERVGTSAGQGSITGIYTVLVEGDDMNDPIADAARSILDGHIVLSRKLASKNQYPAIDLLASTSRVMPDIVSKQQIDLTANFRTALAVYEEAEDLINIGAYSKGSNTLIDYSIKVIDVLRSYMRQSVGEKLDLNRSIVELHTIFKEFPITGIVEANHAGISA